MAIFRKIIEQLMSKWRLYQIFFGLFAFLMVFMFITSFGSGESGVTKFGYLFWVVVSVAIILWARRKGREAKYGKSLPVAHGKKSVDDDDDDE